MWEAEIRPKWGLWAFFLCFRTFSKTLIAQYWYSRGGWVVGFETPWGVGGCKLNSKKQLLPGSMWGGLDRQIGKIFTTGVVNGWSLGRKRGFYTDKVRVIPLQLANQTDPTSENEISGLISYISNVFSPQYAQTFPMPRAWHCGVRCCWHPAGPWYTI